LLSPYLVGGIIAVAYSFDFVNGFHDASNSVATVISTKVLPPFAAVAMAAFFNFIAFAVFGVSVASTIGSGIVNFGLYQQLPNAQLITATVIFSAIVGGVVWDLVTWYAGLPSSSSHALIGGLVGAGLASAGLGVLVWGKLSVVLLYMVLSPVMGFLLAFCLMSLLIRAFFNIPLHVVNRYFRRLQLVSSAAVSLSHGTNDAQKTMGVVTALLIATGYQTGSHFYVQWWVAVLAASAIALGTLMGGWRIVRTLGFRMTRLDPVHGFSIETASAVTIISSSILGIPVSTTHVVSGGVMGSGATMGASTVKWGIARRIIWAWLITIPTAAVVSAVAYLAITLV
jgi:PiT family inorganic phosphate transporter